MGSLIYWWALLWLAGLHLVCPHRVRLSTTTVSMDCGALWEIQSRNATWKCRSEVQSGANMTVDLYDNIDYFFEWDIHRKIKMILHAHKLGRHTFELTMLATWSLRVTNVTHTNYLLLISTMQSQLNVLANDEKFQFKVSWLQLSKSHIAWLANFHRPWFSDRE